ncbi:MAG: sugar phosphate isomerase/epimerase [Phycisphaerales bacterium]|nr:sugar phosphate isomerase/epimerase [Phycisphaerales bacterium]
MDAKRIGVDVDDFRLPVSDAVSKAAKLGFRAVELGLAYPELAPRELSESTARHFVRFVRNLGLDLAALTADFPGLRLTDPARVEERVDRTRAVLDAAARMRVPIVTAAVSALTHPQSGEPSAHATEALRQIAADAGRRGVVFAVRPSADTTEHTARIIQAINSASVKICLDPAALLMSGNDPSKLLSALPQEIVLSHARDATAGGPQRSGVETALGEGDLDWLGHLMLLEAAGYHGPHIVRRTSSQRPAHDLAAAQAYLRSVGDA